MKKTRDFSEYKASVEERRKHIARYSTQVFVKKGYARTNVDDLAEACGMGKGTMYHYIGSKDDIVYLAIQSVGTGLESLMEEIRREVSSLSPVEALRKAIKRYYEYCDETQDNIMFATREMVYLAPRDREEILKTYVAGIALFEELLEAGIQARVFKCSNQSVFAFDIVSRANEWATGRWYLRRRTTLQEYIRQHTEWILNAVCADKNLQEDGSQQELNGGTTDAQSLAT